MWGSSMCWSCRLRIWRLSVVKGGYITHPRRMVMRQAAEPVTIEDVTLNVHKPQISTTRTIYSHLCISVLEYLSWKGIALDTYAIYTHHCSWESCYLVKRKVKRMIVNPGFKKLFLYYKRRKLLHSKFNSTCGNYIYLTRVCAKKSSVYRISQ